MTNGAFITASANGGIHYIHGGKFKSQGDWIHPVGSYETWEFIYMICGCAYLYEEDRRITAREGDCLLLRPNREHGGFAHSSETVSFFWFHFRASADMVPLLEQLPLYAAGLIETQLPLLSRQLLHTSSLSMRYPEELYDALIGMLLTEYAVQTAPNGNGSAEERLVNDIAEWIRINAKSALTASSVALHFGYHEDYLTRLFRRKTGIGLKAYIDRMRISHIRTLLLTTDLPLKSIAGRAGFDDYKAFLKYFVYHESITPTELRERFYRTHTNNH